MSRKNALMGLTASFPGSVSIAAALVAGTVFLSTAAYAQAIDDDTRTATASLTVNLTVSKTEGSVMIALFNSAQSYDGGGAPIRATRVDANAHEMAVQYDNLPVGIYAIRSFHDIDGDGALTTNPFGVPVEPFAFSNGAQVNLGPPPFAMARFELKSGSNTQTLRFDQ